jgi:acyl-coenzyme A synthetase/AMP-(fatty) acid ligase
MKQVRMLKAGAFPRLRFSIFAGEALPVTVATEWQLAAPNARVINMYGPTEATIIISAHVWDKENSPVLAAHGIVPIGRPFPSFSYVIRTSTGERCMKGEKGELLVAGPQVCDGYLHDAVRTNESFIRLPLDDQRTWYCTGDIVREIGDGVLQYLGRVDEQVKIRGYRVEPVEIARVIREHPGVIEAVVLPLRDAENLTVGIRAWVLTDSSLRTQEVMARCKEHLPDYMVPDRIIKVASFPVNESGKIDRTKLYGVF